ncbi:antibiotic biosynthesis monooxygenase (plasmid) [Nostoc sp. C052]|uniref:antibiotic biosynthesis monooxygenase family protein n=1 Tax=Nostoc sp. C052 TaxID=2576902 RepID=UPI0015C39766|nr:antibiotic biosynthesis monooxygenase [Nostoc sp. C052]QLE45326.1 antibiotic biosynthesis monooxygenase [Nostoc sp. C052]
MDSPVVLINVFSVPQGLEDEFLQKWNQTAQLMKSEPGFIETKLHRSLDPTERFQFINIAKWSSKETWQSAFSKRISQNEIFEQQLPIEANPALYQIEAEY